MRAIALPVLIWLLFRNGGYKRRPLDAPPGPDWELTDERFVDPSSGESLEVSVSPDKRRARLRAVEVGGRSPRDVGRISDSVIRRAAAEYRRIVLRYPPALHSTNGTIAFTSAR